MEKIPCKKCLLSEVNAQEELKKIRELIEKMPPKEKASEPEYERRLSRCKECEDLVEGTCMACGCYVELRAAKLTATCPKKKGWAC